MNLALSEASLPDSIAFDAERKKKKQTIACCKGLLTSKKSRTHSTGKQRESKGAKPMEIREKDR